MKRKLILLLASALLLTLIGCGSADIDTTVSEDLETAPMAPDISTASLGITLAADNVTPTGLTIVCTQSGGEATGELSTGSYYIIEKLVDDKWTAVDYAYDGSSGELAWTAEAWLINMNGTTEWVVDWSWLYGELEAGSYRIGKEIMDWREPGNYDIYTAYAEFEIK